MAYRSQHSDESAASFSIDYTRERQSHREDGSKSRSRSQPNFQSTDILPSHEYISRGVPMSGSDWHDGSHNEDNSYVKYPKHEPSAQDTWADEHRDPFLASHEYHKYRDKYRLSSSDMKPQLGTPSFIDDFILEHGSDPQRQITTRLSMNVDFRLLFSEELEPSDNLADVVVLVGGFAKSPSQPGAAQATTIATYIKKAWPKSVDYIMTILDYIKKSSTAGVEVTTVATGLKGKVSLSVLPRSESLSLVIRGPVDVQADLLEATAWLCTVLQIDTRQNVPFPCSVELGEMAKKLFSVRGVQAEKDGVFEYDMQASNGPQFLSEVHWQQETGTCWKTLFPCTPCATQFWTPSQPHGMKGLRLSFELLCYMTGVQYVAMEGEGLVLYGPRSMVYPVSQTKDCVQWHFQPIDYQTQSPPLGRRLMVSDIEDLSSVRKHYLGLWQNAEINLGTENSTDSEVGWSEARKVEKVVTLDGFSIGGTIGLPKSISLSGNTSFKVMKSRRNVFMTNFEDNCQASVAEPVILYSVKEKRAWMVPYVNVLLYLARARAKYQRISNFGLPSCRNSGNGEAALRCILDNRRKSVRPVPPGEMITTNEEPYLVQEYVKNIAAALEVARKETSRAKRWLNISESLLGFELADIVKMRKTMDLKKHRLDGMFPRGSWIGLLDKAPLLFFCENLPEVLIPDQDMDFSGKCGRTTWQTVPKGFNLMAASLPCLAYIAEPLGHNHLDALTDDYFWYCPDALFARCRRTDRHTCFRVQELTPRDKGGIRVMLEDAREDGVVLFRHKDQADTIEANINRQQNPRDSRGSGDNLAVIPQRHRPYSDSGYSSGGTEDDRRLLAGRTQRTGSSQSLPRARVASEEADHRPQERRSRSRTTHRRTRKSSNEKSKHHGFGIFRFGL